MKLVIQKLVIHSTYQTLNQTSYTLYMGDNCPISDTFMPSKVSYSCNLHIRKKLHILLSVLGEYSFI